MGVVDHFVFPTLSLQKNRHKKKVFTRCHRMCGANDRKNAYDSGTFRVGIFPSQIPIHLSTPFAPLRSNVIAHNDPMYGSSNTTSPKTATTASPSSSSSGPSTTPPTLGHFCIYNPDFGQTDETQHEQLLYYVARKTVSMDVKLRNIGLAQGLVNFAR